MGIEGIPAEMSLKSIRVKEETRTRRLLGREISKNVVITEELVYVDLEGEGLKKTALKVVRQHSIPSELRELATTLISQIYSDAKESWNPEAIGDELNTGRAVVEAGIDERASDVGIALKGKIKPQRVLLLANCTFASVEGQRNTDFQGFLKRQIVIRMGITPQEMEELKIADW